MKILHKITIAAMLCISQLATAQQVGDTTTSRAAKYLKMLGKGSLITVRAADLIAGYGLMARDLYYSYRGFKKINEIRNNPEALQDYYSQLSDAPKEIKDLTLSLAQKEGLSSHFVVKTDHHASGSGAGALPMFNAILIDQNFTSNPPDQQKAILAHELIHMKYNDQRNKGLVKTFAPLATAASCLLIAAGITKASTVGQAMLSSTGWNNLARTLGVTGKISSFILKSALLQYGIGTLLAYKYDRFTEKRADIESAQLAGTAQGFINHLQDEITRKKLMDQEILKLREQGFEVIDTHPQWQLLNDHPTNQERIAYLKPFVQQGK